MESEQLITSGSGSRYFQMQSEHTNSFSFSLCQEPTSIFDLLPIATIVQVSRPDASDITPMLLSYTIEFQYKQKRAFIEEMHEKQEQVKEWLQNLGIGKHTAVVQDDDADDEAVLLHHDESAKNRNVPSSAALPIIRPALVRQESIADRAKVAMQGYLNRYLNHFLGNMDIVNSREVCRFLEVSKLSFSPEYGPKLKEDYVMVKQLPKIQKDED